jgi:hypothetical protein
MLSKKSFRKMENERPKLAITLHSTIVRSLSMQVETCGFLPT